MKCILGFATLAGLLLAQTGCSVLKPKPDLTQFYVLRAQAAASRAEASTNGALPELRIGPGRIAAYLEATPVAVQDGPNRLKYLDLHQWAEPLSKGISRTLGENLAGKLNGTRIVLYPDPLSGPSSYEVRYAVNHFEGTLEGPVTLDVTWQIVQPSSGRVRTESQSVYEIAPDAGGEPDVAAYVSRMSQALSRWAQDIAAAIRAVPTR